MVVLLVGVVGATQLPGLLASKPSKPEPTVWEGITSGIKDGTVPKDVALEAFAYLYKVDIPGVTVPKGIDASDRPTSGSGALRWVRANWDQLTAAQQAVVTGVTTPGPNDVFVTIDATTGQVTPGASAGTGRSRAGNLGLAIAPPVLTRDLGAADAPSSAVADAIEAELIADIQHIGTKLKLPVISEGLGLWKNITLDITEKSGGGTLMTASAELNGVGHYNPCAVTVYKEAWDNETAPSLSAKFHVLMTHEVIHCYQHVVEGDVDTALAVPAWITEGTALWLAASDTGTAEPMIPSMWEKGYFYPEKALTNRSYDAFGYYALLDHLGRDLWSRIVPAWTAAATSNQRSNAFIGVLQGDDPDVRNVWASSYSARAVVGRSLDHLRLRASRLGPGVTPPRPGHRRARAGPALSRAARTPFWTFDSSSGEVVTITTTGLASLHDQKGASLLAFQSGTFCVSGECICPDNTPRAGEKAADKNLGLPFDVAFNAPEGGSSYSIVATKLEEACGKKPTPPPSGPVRQRLRAARTATRTCSRSTTIATTSRPQASSPC